MSSKSSTSDENRMLFEAILAEVKQANAGLERLQGDVTEIRTELAILRAEQSSRDVAPRAFSSPARPHALVPPGAHNRAAMQAQDYPPYQTPLYPTVGYMSPPIAYSSPVGVPTPAVYPSPAAHSARVAASAPPAPVRESRVNNMQQLPFALEQILFEARKLKKKNQPVQYCHCRKPAGLPACFKKRHFDWCARHAQEVPVGGNHCVLEDDCRVLFWEHVPNWVELVRWSKISGELGRKVDMAILDTVLFDTS